MSSRTRFSKEAIPPIRPSPGPQSESADGLDRGTASGGREKCFEVAVKVLMQTYIMSKAKGPLQWPMIWAPFNGACVPNGEGSLLMGWIEGLHHGSGEKASKWL